MEIGFRYQPKGAGVTFRVNVNPFFTFKETKSDLKYILEEQRKKKRMEYCRTIQNQKRKIVSANSSPG